MLKHIMERLLRCRLWDEDLLRRESWQLRRRLGGCWEMKQLLDLETDRIMFYKFASPAILYLRPVSHLRLAYVILWSTSECPKLAYTLNTASLVEVTTLLGRLYCGTHQDCSHLERRIPMPWQNHMRVERASMALLISLQKTKQCNILITIMPQSSYDWLFWMQRDGRCTAPSKKMDDRIEIDVVRGRFCWKLIWESARFQWKRLLEILSLSSLHQPFISFQLLGSTRLEPVVYSCATPVHLRSHHVIFDRVWELVLVEFLVCRWCLCRHHMKRSRAADSLFPYIQDSKDAIQPIEKCIQTSKDDRSPVDIKPHYGAWRIPVQITALTIRLVQANKHVCMIIGWEYIESLDIQLQERSLCCFYERFCQENQLCRASLALRAESRPPVAAAFTMPRNMPLHMDDWDLNVYGSYTNTAINAIPGGKTSAG